jgi:hypothetical protein
MDDLPEVVDGPTRLRGSLGQLDGLLDPEAEPIFTRE